MILHALFFYLFSVIVILSAVMVIWARNPVHSVLFLILAFFNAAGLFVLLGAEFIAMLLVIVYVGAVMVLFLFVVMMLDVDFAELKAGYMKHAPLGGLVVVVLVAELASVLIGYVIAPSLSGAIAAPNGLAGGLTNTEALGRILYTQYLYFFEAAGIVLLISMIGAIVLTLRHKEGVKRQDIGVQVARNPASAIRVVRVAPGEAVVPAAKGRAS